MPKELSKCREWEKERRNRLNEAFTTLCKLLPCYDPSNNISKIDILTNAANYIGELQTKIKQLTTENSDENIKKLKGDECKKLQDRVKRLLSKNETLCSLLREAKITIPPGCAVLRKFKTPPLFWSNRILPEQAKVLQKKELEKENDESAKKLGRKFTNKKQKVSGQSTPKHRKAILNRSDPKKVRPPKKKKGKALAPSKCVIVLSQPTVTQPCYVITNAPSNNLVGGGTSTVITNSGLVTNPLVSAKATKPVSSIPPLGPGTLILANGTILPVLPQQTVLPLAPQIITRPPIILVPKNPVSVPSTSTTTKIVTSTVKTLTRIRPKYCLTKTTQVNKVPIPALTSRYSNPEVVLKKSEPKPAKAKHVEKKSVKESEKKAEVLETGEKRKVPPLESVGIEAKKIKTGDDGTAQKEKVHSEKAPEIVREVPPTEKKTEDKVKEPEVKTTEVSTDNKNNDKTSEETKKPEETLDLNINHSELSNDIFASLQVPAGCQNPESTSPTAAFLLAFPLVSSGVKVTEVTEEDNPESQRGTPTLLQIGTMNNTKPTQSESLTPSLLNLDNLSFFSSKDMNGFYNSFDGNIATTSTVSAVSRCISSTKCTEKEKTAIQPEKRDYQQHQQHQQPKQQPHQSIQQPQKPMQRPQQSIQQPQQSIQKPQQVIQQPQQSIQKPQQVIQQPQQPAQKPQHSIQQVQQSIQQPQQSMQPQQPIPQQQQPIQQQQQPIQQQQQPIQQQQQPIQQQQQSMQKSQQPIQKAQQSIQPPKQSIQQSQQPIQQTQKALQQLQQSQQQSIQQMHQQSQPRQQQLVQPLQQSLPQTSRQQPQQAIQSLQQPQQQPQQSVQSLQQQAQSSHQQQPQQSVQTLQQHQQEKNQLVPCFDHSLPNFGTTNNTNSVNQYQPKPTTNHENKQTACTNYSSQKGFNCNNFEVTKVSTTCTYANVIKNYPEPLYTNSGSYTYSNSGDINFNQNYYKDISKTDNRSYYSLNYENYADYRKNDSNSYFPGSNYYPNTNYSKEKFPTNNTNTQKNKNNTQSRPPINWMTTPDNRLQTPSEYLPQFTKEPDFYPSNTFTNTQTTYFNTNPMYSTNEVANQDTRKSLDLSLAPPVNTYQRTNEVEDNQFSWSPTKIPQFLDPPHSFVSSTLPTLVGDLALGNPPNFGDQKGDKCQKKESRRLKTYEGNQGNFLSVSQLVEHNKEVVPARTTTRRNSGNRSSVKKVAPKSSQRKEKEGYPQSNKVETNAGKGMKQVGYSSGTGEIFCESKNRNVKNNYSAEALIGHQMQSDGGQKNRQQNYNKPISVSSFLHDNILPYFPAVDLPQDNTYMQQNQNYQTSSFTHNFPSTFQNNTYTANSFIPTTTITSTYNFMHDVTHDYSDNLNLFPVAKDKTCPKGTTRNQREQQCPTTPKKPKRKHSNDLPGFVDFPFLSMPGSINSPILPDDFHTHTGFLQPPTPQLYPCKNPFTKPNDVGSLLPLPPVPVTRSNIQHPEISPNINSAGTSLTNFNLSTIFPEINNKSALPDSYAGKDRSYTSTVQVTFNDKPTFSFSYINATSQPYNNQ